MVVVHHPRGRSCYAFTDDPLYNGIGAVWKGGAMLPNRTMNKSQVLKTNLLLQNILQKGSQKKMKLKTNLRCFWYNWILYNCRNGG